ncbi:MAG: hypothetical protein RIT26_809 [Pseudomonadota bacterium]
MTPLRLHPMIFALALASMGSSRAQSLVDLYGAAKKYDATYLSAVAQYEANRARADQALAGVLPRAALSASTQRTGVDVEPFGPGANVSAATSPYYRYFSTHAMTLSAAQPLYNPANRLFYEQSRKQLAQAVQLLVTAEQDLLVKTSQAYFDVLGSQDSLSFVRAQKAAVSEQLAAAKRNFEVGTATITDTREAEARFDLIRAQEIAAENDLRVKRLALDQLVGMTNAQPLPLNTQAELSAPAPNDPEAWVSAAMRQHPSLLSAELNAEVARMEIDRARAGHLPTLELQANLAQTRNAGGTSLSGLSSQINSQAVGLALNMPLFAGFSVQNRVAETVALEEKARLDLEAARRNVSQAVRTAYLGLVSGIGQVNALKAAEDSSQLALDANKLGYTVGVRINIDVLNSQSQLYQTKRDLAQARYNVLLGSLKLRQANGTLQAQDLQSVSNLLK